MRYAISMVRSHSNNFLLYLVMLIPAFPLAWDFVDQQWYYAQMMYESGIWAVWFLIVTISVSPVLLLINRIGFGKAFGRWFLKARRHFGLVTAIYAALHLAHYIRETERLVWVLQESTRLAYATGWIAFLIMLALAVTSNNTSIRKLGRRWKPLHRWIYPAAGFTFLHWYLLDFYTERVLFWAAIFCLPKLLQFGLKKIPVMTARYRTAPKPE